MTRPWLGAAAIAAVAWAGVACAADPPAQYRPEDVVKAYGAGTAASCAPGTVTDPDGGCDPVVPKTRGFSLAAPGAAKRHGEAAAARSAARTSGAPVYKASAPLTRQARPGDLLITFKLGSAELTPQARANARAFAEALNSPALAGTHFAIGGHTDASGSAARNLSLSDARAQAVKSFLVAQGVDDARLEAKGYGSQRLADPAHPKSAANRRVEGLRLN
jgi:outer membrane protein OmpA-like peptidoglycan-associated protein